MCRGLVLVLLIPLIIACDLDDPTNYNGGVACLLKWIRKAKVDLEGEKFPLRHNSEREFESNIKRNNNLNKNFLRFGRNYFTKNDDVQEKWSDNGNRKLLSLKSARLIRELGRKRGSLEKNFLRFGRDVENKRNVPVTKRDTSTENDNFVSYHSIEQQRPMRPLEDDIVSYGLWTERTI